MLAVLLALVVPGQAIRSGPEYLNVNSVRSQQLAPVVNAPLTLDRGTRTDAEIDTIVVCPQPLLAALGPWLKHRSRQGHRLLMLEPSQSPSELKDRIRQAATHRNLRHIVLVGDSEPTAFGNSLVRARSIPAHLAEARINIRWGSEPDIATDNYFADIDDDQIPDVSIGRLSVDDEDQLRTMVGKIIAYENGHHPGLWRRRVNFVAGGGGFGPLTDAIIESACKKLITDEIPPEYNANMTYGSWRSPYCPSPLNFRATAFGRLNEGCLFWVYIGHGRLTRLERLKVPGADMPIMEADDLYDLHCQNGLPIALLLACYTGAYDHSQDCLAEELVRHAQGPIAVIAGSRVTMPYAMAVLSTGLLEGFTQQRCATAGELLLHAKQVLAADRQVTGSRALLDSIARAISPAKNNLDAERMEHLLLFNLIGDPLLRLPLPERVIVRVPKQITAGGMMIVKGQSDVEGPCLVELVCRRDRTKSTLGRRLRYLDSESALARMNDTYRAANDRRWAVAQVRADRGRFAVKLAVPAEAHGPGHVRVFIQGQERHALGASDIYVRQPVSGIGG